MNRFLLFALLWCATNTILNAQSVELCRQVLAASGKNSQLGGRFYSYTVGEFATATLVGADHKATQGFQQPEICKLVATDDLDLERYQIEVFPNPTENYLTIRYAAQVEGALQASVTDMLGRTVVRIRALDDSSGSVLDCSKWQPGVYFLNLSTNDGRAFSSMRFIKL